MEYSTFINETERAIEQMNESEKTVCLQNLIRIADKDQLEQVYQVVVGGAQSKQLLEQEFKQWKQYLEKLDSMSGHFVVEVDRDQPYDYWDDEEYYIYHDPKEIGPKLNACAAFAEKLLLAQSYTYAKELYETLYLMPFYVYSEEMEDYFESDLEELAEHNIVSLNPNQFATSYLYTIYQTTAANERPKKLFRAWSMQLCYAVKLADVFSAGAEPLPDNQKFLEEWIAFLQNKTERMATELFLEAVKLSKTYTDNEALLRLAKKTRTTKPEVYLWLIEKLILEAKFDKAITIGKAALQDIPQRFSQRSEIAESLIALAKEQQVDTNIRYLLEESFYSLPTIDKLLQLLETGLSSTEMDRIIQFVSQKQVEHRLVMLFFLQQFDTCYTGAARNKQALGWRTSSKGQLIPLFLLLFMDNLDTPAATLLEKEIAYFIYPGNWSDFVAAFKHWKACVHPDAKTKEKIFAWCQKEIKKREEALIQTQYRDHYARAAALVIAMGEAEEALGNLGAAERNWQYYRQKHSRKSSFGREMKRLHTNNEADKSEVNFW